MAAKVHARAEAAVLVFAEWADACGMWLEASSARVAINQPATGLQLHGSITQALEWAVDAWESVRTVSLRLDDAEPFDDSYCITVVLQALAASCPMLHTLLLDNTIKGVGTLRVVREVFPDITKVAVSDIRLECWVYGDYDSDRTDVAELTAHFGIDRDGSYPVADQYSELLLWPSLNYTRIAMPITSATLDAWANVLRNRRDLTHVEICDIYHVPAPYDDAAEDTPVKRAVQLMYQLLEAYPMDTLTISTDVGDDRAEELVDRVRATQLRRAREIRRTPSRVQAPERAPPVAQDYNFFFVPKTCLARRVVLHDILTHPEDGLYALTPAVAITPASYPNMTELHLRLFCATFCARMAELYTVNSARLLSFSVSHAWFCQESIQVLLAAAAGGVLQELFVHYLDIHATSSGFDELASASQLLAAAATSPSLKLMKIGGVRDGTFAAADLLGIVNAGRDNGCEVIVVQDIDLESWPGVEMEHPGVE